MDTKKWNKEISKFYHEINKGGKFSKKDINKIINEDKDNERRVLTGVRLIS